MSDFKKIRNILFYNGFKVRTAGDMSYMVIDLGGGDEVVLDFSAGGDVLTEIHPYNDNNEEIDGAYDNGYDDAKAEWAEEEEAAYSAGHKAGLAEGKAMHQHE